MGDLMMIAGFLTRLVTLPLIAIGVGAILLVKADVRFIVADAACHARGTRRAQKSRLMLVTTWVVTVPPR